MNAVNNSPLMPPAVYYHEVESDPEEDPIEFQVEGPVDAMGVGPTIEYFNDSSSTDEYMEFLEAEVEDSEDEDDHYVHPDALIIADLHFDVAQLQGYVEAEEAHVEELQIVQAAHIQTIEDLEAKVVADKAQADALLQVMEKRWLDEAERSHQLQRQLEDSKEEIVQHKATISLGKRKFCDTLLALVDRVKDFPIEKGKLHYKINKWVVTEMIHESYNETRLS